MVRAGIVAALLLALAGCTATDVPTNSAERQASRPAREPDVPYEPSPHPVVRAMLELADVKPGDVVYDLGSGDGRIPIAAARDFGARAVGIEIDPKLVAKAVANAEKAGVSDRVQFRTEDLFEADFSEATVVTLFLWPEVNIKLRPKLFAELKPGTRVVSHWHDMDEWNPETARHVHGRNLYLWRIPER
jgi:protein-L-isoaspartate O-methyltransferase